MIIKEKAFESFTWIDIENANKKELEVIASKYNLNYFLIKDALDIGHLPKYEQLHKHDFFIFRDVFNFHNVFYFREVECILIDLILLLM